MKYVTNGSAFPKLNRFVTALICVLLILGCSEKKVLAIKHLLIRDLSALMSCGGIPVMGMRPPVLHPEP
jgi:hypothetical protein